MADSATSAAAIIAGHTPACVSYQIGDAVFVGDTLFMPDYAPVPVIEWE